MKLKKIEWIILLLSVVIPLSAQHIDAYNKLGSDVVIKQPIPNSEFNFGGFYNEAKALVYFERFWFEGRIGMKFSLDNNNVGKLAIMSDRTYGNVSWTPFSYSEFVFGTNYYKMIPGTYMNSFDDVLPSARFAKTGFSYINTSLKENAGLTFAVNIPLQDEMFSENHGMDINGAIIYENPLGFNLGTTMYSDFQDDFMLGLFASGINLKLPVTWMIGYTLNGKGINGATPADHYFDTTLKFTGEKFNISTDFEIGFNNDNDKKIPIYAGVLGVYSPISAFTAKLGAMYTISNASDYNNSNNVLFLYPRFVFTHEKHEFAVGTQITFADTVENNSAVGLAFPIHWKYYF